MPLTVSREVERPTGNSISYSQASHACDLQLKWHRERVKRAGLSIFLVYGSAVHRGIEAYGKGQARTHQEAVRAATSYLDREISSPYRKTMPLTWDEPPETTKDGSISKAIGNYGRLWNRDVATYWLQRQIPAYLKIYGDTFKIQRVEHQVFVPMRRAPNWKSDWAFEARLDIECAGDEILDLKTTNEPWDNPRKYRMQAHLYMGAYYMHYGREPKFRFLVLPRIHGPDKIQEFEIPFDPEQTQRYIDGVVRRKIDLAEAGIFVANPSAWVCDEKRCAWWYHCRFGAGDAM